MSVNDILCTELEYIQESVFFALPVACHNMHNTCS